MSRLSLSRRRAQESIQASSSSQIQVDPSVSLLDIASGSECGPHDNVGTGTTIESTTETGEWQVGRKRRRTQSLRAAEAEFEPDLTSGVLLRSAPRIACAPRSVGTIDLTHDDEECVYRPSSADRTSSSTSSSSSSSSKSFSSFFQRSAGTVLPKSKAVAPPSSCPFVTGHSSHPLCPTSMCHACALLRVHLRTPDAPSCTPGLLDPLHLSRDSPCGGAFVYFGCAI